MWSTLAHFVRNAVAHGIEPGHKRIAAGEPQEGRITLHAPVFDAKLTP